MNFVINLITVFIFTIFVTYLLCTLACTCIWFFLPEIHLFECSSCVIVILLPRREATRTSPVSPESPTRGEGQECEHILIRIFIT